MSYGIIERSTPYESRRSIIVIPILLVLSLIARMFKFPGCLFRLLPAFWAVFLRKACEHILENNSKPHADDPFGVSEAAMWMQLYQAHNYKHNYYSYYSASTCGIAGVLVVVVLIV